MEVLGRESTSTENVSPGGARVRTKEAPQGIETVRISCGSRGFVSLAVVRNRFAGADGCDRLCLQFIQSKWPA
jgi:hypothetical protein